MSRAYFSESTNANPPGAMVMFGGSVAPAGYLMCDGASVATVTYPNLFAAIGYGFGGAGAVFNVPDMRGASPAGVGTSIGYIQNETIALGQKIDDQMQGHLHQRNPINGIEGVWTTPGTSGATPGGGWSLIFGADNTYFPVSDGANGTPRTGPVTKGKTVGINFIIKY